MGVDDVTGGDNVMGGDDLKGLMTSQAVMLSRAVMTSRREVPGGSNFGFGAKSQGAPAGGRLGWVDEKLRSASASATSFTMRCFH